MLDFLSALFRSLSPLWEMSVTAAYAAAVVIVLRLLLKKRAPKQVLCLLWLVVFARLLIPVSLESPLSIVPDALPGQEYLAEQAPAAPGAGAPVIPAAGDPAAPIVPQDPALDQSKSQAGSDTVTPVTGNRNPSLSIPEGVGSAAPAPEATAAFPWQAVIAGVWLAGAAAMGGYALISWLRLRRRLFDAIRAGDGAWEHPAVDSPFILGVLRPRIYLPAGLTGQPRQFIMCHERAHLRRLDHIVKPVCWIALALHWFNPLVWAAFLIMSRDIESACDEAVVRQLGSRVKADYSETLLALATGRRLPAPCPLAFDEGDARGRIRNVLSYRRPALWVIIVSVIAAALAAVCLLTDPVAAKAEGDPDPGPDATTSQDPDTVISQPPVNLADDLLDPWMKEVLDGELEFRMEDRGSMTVDQLSEAIYDSQHSVTVSKVCIIDLDRDGINEMVVWPSLNGDDSIEAVSVPGYLILRRQGDVVYGYNPPYRGFADLKADGTFEWSSSAFEGGNATMSFEVDRYELNYITWCDIYNESDARYFVEGRKATREEFLAACDAQDAKPEPIWYAYKDGVLSVWAPTLTPLGQTDPEYDTGEARLWLDEGSRPWLEWNGSTAKLSCPPMSTDEYGYMRCRDFDRDGQDEVVIVWFLGGNGFAWLNLYEWDGDRDRPTLSASYDTQQLLVRFNRNNVAAYNKDTRGLSVTYAHTEGNDSDPDYYRHYVTGHTTLPENFFDGYENIRDSYLHAYAYQFHLFYPAGLDFYLDFDIYLADETMQELDYVDVPMDENQELSPYYAGYHYMAYQPVGTAAFNLRYDGTDWRVLEPDELVMDGRGGEDQAGDLNDIYTAAPLNAPIVDPYTMPDDPKQWYKVAELPDDMIWMFSRDYGAETLLRWDGNFFQLFDRTAHTSYGIMPRLKKLGGTNTYGPLAVISNWGKGTGTYMEELVVYDLDAAPTAIDYTHDWRPLRDDFNENVSWQFDKDTRTLTYTYQGQTVDAVIDANDEAYRRIEHDYPELKQEDLRLCVTGEFVYYRFDLANDGDIIVELSVELFVGDEVVPLIVPGWVSWSLRFNGSGFDTVPGSCVLGYPGYGV